MFHTVTTKQTETRQHTQAPHAVKVKVEGGLETGKSESRARENKVLIIFAALTVSGFVTKNNVKSYKFDILIVRCTVSHLCGLSELTLTQVHTMKLLKKGKMEKFEAG